MAVINIAFPYLYWNYGTLRNWSVLHYSGFGGKSCSGNSKPEEKEHPLTQTIPSWKQVTWLYKKLGQSDAKG